MRFLENPIEEEEEEKIVKGKKRTSTQANNRNVHVRVPNTFGNPAHNISI